MSPAFSNSLEKKKPYFTIVDKNQDHPKKPYFDVACFEVLEDDRFYSSLRYKKKAFFKGLVKFVRFEGKQKMEPFKLWKIKWDRSAKEFEKRNVDPDLFRHLLASSSFLVIGDLRNKPKGYGLENYQIVETDTHKVQQAQQNEYKKSLQPIVEFCKSIQYDMENLREYMFCRSCKAKRKYTLLSKENRYRNQAYYVCKSCAGKEVLK